MSLPLRALNFYRWEATVPYCAPMNTSAWRRHWSHANRERKQWQQLLAFAFPSFARPSSPLTYARVTVTRVSCASKHPDPDNLAYSSKPILDALVSLRILADDGPEIERVWRWERGPRRKPLTRIFVEELA